MKKEVIPTIFAMNKREFDERLDRLVEVAKNLQIDFMDGEFVKAKGIELDDVPNLKRYKNYFEAHLMTKSPEKKIKKLKGKGFKKIIFHYEAVKNYDKIKEIVIDIRKNRMNAWIAVNPETSLDRIIGLLNEVDGIMFMGVHPGKEHQKFIPKVYEKIKALRQINKSVKIQVDGGVNLKIARKLVGFGVDYINSGSFVSESENPKERLNIMNSVFRRKGGRNDSL